AFRRVPEIQGLYPKSKPPLLGVVLICFAPCGGGGDVHFCEYSAIEGPCIPTLGEKSGFIDVFYE
ncbi:hypothetical protein ABG983_01565, partial [Collinsella aerofaciens]|uniref:hypothetical protein n=1 Tax=Collinsella aerofaciens TaxID=74426 RepID=UPI00325BE7E5